MDGDTSLEVFEGKHFIMNEAMNKIFSYESAKEAKEYAKAMVELGYRVKSKQLKEGLSLQVYGRKIKNSGRVFTSLTQVISKRGYREDDPIMSVNQHRGQAKLFANEVDFIENYGMNCTEIVVAGGAPGIHYSAMAMMYPELTFHLFDPATTAEHGGDDNGFSSALRWFKNVEVHRMELDVETAKAFMIGRRPEALLYISDLRTNKVGKEPEDEDIVKDNYLNGSIMEILKPAYSMLKFRPLYKTDEMTYYTGRLMLQPFAPKHSTELRLITNGKSVTTYDCRDIEERMSFYNAYIRPSSFLGLNHDERLFCELVGGNRSRWAVDSLANLLATLNKFSQEAFKKGIRKVVHSGV